MNARVVALFVLFGAQAAIAQSPPVSAPEQAAAPTGTPRNLLVAPPDSSDITLGEADVPSGRFSGPWQTGAFEGFRFRRFPDASASLGAERQMADWRIDIACLPTTGICTYAAQGVPDAGAMDAAERLGEWLVSLPPPPPPPQPKPPESPEAPPAAIPTLQPDDEVAPAPEPEAPTTDNDVLDLPAAVTGPSLLPTTPPATEGPAIVQDGSPAPQPLPPRSPTPARDDVALPAAQPLPPRSPTPATARAASPATQSAAPSVPGSSGAPLPAAVASPVATASPPDICARLVGDTPMEQLQRLLAEEGFDPGPPDGQAGPRTVSAARAALDAPVDILAVAQALALIDRLLCDDRSPQ